LSRADLTNRCLYIVPACSALSVVGGLAVAKVVTCINSGNAIAESDLSREAVVKRIACRARP
jgi:hypothetical protein